MSATSSIASKIANFRGESRCSKNEAALQTNSLVMLAARKLWPSKTALELSAKTGVSERMAAYWLAGRYDISADALAALLRSDHGLSVLEQIMGDARPKWWKRIKRAASLAAMRLSFEEQKKKIEQFELDLDS